MKCGKHRFDPPYGGDWPYHDYQGKLAFPRRADIAGIDFRRTWLALPRSNTRAHYRENVAEGALHLRVLWDGTYSIDHEECFNPSFGPKEAVLHVVHDSLEPTSMSVAEGARPSGAVPLTP